MIVSKNYFFHSINFIGERSLGKIFLLFLVLKAIFKSSSQMLLHCCLFRVSPMYLPQCCHLVIIMKISAGCLRHPQATDDKRCSLSACYHKSRPLLWRNWMEVGCCGRNFKFSYWVHEITLWDCFVNRAFIYY